MLQMFNTRPEINEPDVETEAVQNFQGDALGLMTRTGISSLDRARPTQPARIAGGLGPSPEMTKVCPSDVKFITPKRALNRNKVIK